MPMMMTRMAAQLNWLMCFLALRSNRKVTSLPTAFARPPERVSHAYDVNTKGRTDESVHVFVSPPEQHPYEGEQQESGQLPKCFSKASEIVLPFQQPPLSATATDQMQFQASKSMPNYDVYEK